MKRTREPLKAVDFFCCSGGVTCGFRMAGIQVLGGIDIEGAYKKTYEENNKNSKFIEADIAKYQPEQLIKDLCISRDMDNMIFIGCSPCQYYTTIQTDKSKSSQGRLLLDEFKRFVEYFRPGYIFIENVPGLETKAGSPLADFKEYIFSIGYAYGDNIVNASDFNVPQNRKRYVLIASRLNKKIKIPVAKNKNKITVRKVISKLPAIPAGYRNQDESKHWAGKLSSINQKRINKTPHNGGTRLAWKDDDELQLKCYRGKDKTFTDVYGRMFWDQPSPTITTKFYSISNGRFGHPEQDRALSLKEGAILQSFPDNYIFYSESMVTVAKMIGNAVPPQLAKAIGNKLKRSYNRQL